jgi:lipoprotein-releasing system ATP-binding protein
MMLNVKGLFKSFGSGKEKIEVLKGVEFSMAEGEIAALMGPSGVGKSTLLHLVAGLDKPDSGEIRIASNLVTALKGCDLDSFRNSTIGIIYQHNYLLSEFTALENAFLPALKKEKAMVAKKKAEELLRVVGLQNRLKHFPSELSGGEQQRVAVARSLVNSPLLLLADEPTGDLDEKTSEIVFGLLHSIVRSRGLTLLMATHNTGLAEKCDRIMKLHNGQIG